MHKHAIWHTPYDSMAYPLSDDRLEIVLRAARGDLRRVEAVYTDRYTPHALSDRVRLWPTGSDELFDYWRGSMELQYGRFMYYFELEDGETRIFYGEGGFSERPPQDEPWTWCFQYPCIWHHDGMDDPPAWARDAVVYQIFVDRFANGDPANDPAGTSRWGALPTPRSFSGGDLAGIIQKLDYMSSLGVSCLYLTPIFLSSSNHKYDTIDYFRIDPHFGDEETAKKLVDECHSRGIRVVLDAVFNHSGYEFFAFQDVVEKGKDSPYWKWFNVHEFPVRTRPKPNYETFGPGIWQMPKFRTDNPEVRDYLISAAEHWTRTLDIDGWRLDVADDVDHGFWREFRTRMRLIRPDILIVGEILHDASPFLRGDQMDSVMNYPWRELCLNYFARRRIGTAAFAVGLTATAMRNRRQVQYAMWNLLGSHDRERFLTACQGDAARVMLASTFQFTYTGTPYIYYGDEIGLEGEDDPDCRRCMPWDEDKWDRKLLKHYRDLAQLRAEHAVLRRGEFASLVADGPESPFVCARWDDGACIVVALNNTEEPREVDVGLVSERMSNTHGLECWAGMPMKTVFWLEHDDNGLEELDVLPAPASETGGRRTIKLPAMGAGVFRVED
ncbi:MAG: glycoside hydrolase family 13 protein [Firmicutes bacterium]|nr:glycoside hydrolase family 13 protein [Bacillota bacterium]MDD4336374.1 glycoside hydrolase family 13 protein [Bacillota bacterium]MDD4791469.1 glycoside hydrolase family 13 protein [Bacillota bacterium]